MSGAGTGINPFCRVRFSSALLGAAAPPAGSLAAQMSDLRGEMTQMESRLQDRLATQTRWMVAMIVAAPTVTVALQAYFT
jgi:hypothetical protein